MPTSRSTSLASFHACAVLVALGVHAGAVHAQAASTVPSAEEAKRARARQAAADWRSLHLMASLIEQRVYCIRELGDRSAEAVALVAAAEASAKTPEAVAADEAEARVRELRLSEWEEGRAEEAARAYLALANARDPRGAEAKAARQRVSEAHAAALASGLGKRVKAASEEARKARAKANETAAMRAAVRAFEAHTAAQKARAAASPELQAAQRACIQRWATTKVPPVQ